MQLSLPTSRFSLLGSGKLKSISRSKSTRSNYSTVRSESQLSTLADSETLSRTLSLTASAATHGVDAPPAQSRPPPRPDSFRGLRRAYSARSREKYPNGLENESIYESDSDDASASESVHMLNAATPANLTKWIDLDDRSSSADYEKEAYRSQHEATADRRMSEETMKEVNGDTKPFQGLGDYGLDLGKSRKLIDDEYLKDAFGITMSRRESEDVPVQEKLFEPYKDESIPPLPSSAEIASPMSEKSDVFEMDVPLTIDMNLSSGVVDDLRAAHVQDQMANSRSASDSDELTSTDSSGSTLKQARLATQLKGESATAVAIVSPAQVVESPKPRRPFSTVSIAGMTTSRPKKTPPELAIKSANSMSSDDTSGVDGKSSEHSPRSSISSVVSANGPTKKPESRSSSGRREAGPRGMDATATRYDNTAMYHEALASRESHSAASNKRPHEARHVRRQGSDTSIKSNPHFPANVNKPLPPEPGQASKRLSHISEQSSTPSRSSSVTIRQSHYATRSRTVDEALPGGFYRSPNDSQPDSRMSTISGFSLRSKYTPKDLDALDDAFERGDPPQKHRAHFMNNSYQASPSSSQTSLVAEGRLGTIREDGRSHYGQGSRKGSVSKDQQQPSRGPMRAEHGRKQSLPTPTRATSRKNSLVSLMVDKSPGRPAPKGRSQSTNHISSQTTDTQEPPVQRSATIVVGGSSKAHRILGKPMGLSSPIPEAQFERNWPRHDSPEPLDTAQNEVESPDRPQDAHFEEIRQRMELLSPKDDPNDIFLSIHERNAERRGTPGYKPLTRTVREVERRVQPKQPEAEPTEIAELEAAEIQRRKSAQRASEIRPFELEGCQPAVLAELPIPSPPMPSASEGSRFVPPPPPPPPTSDPPPSFERRGRVDNLEIPSSVSSKSRSNPSQRSNKARSIASIVASEIPDIYAGLPSQGTNSLRPSMITEDEDPPISADAAERVLYRILQSLDNLSDLFAAARVSRGFYRTFKHHERPLLRLMLWRMSPAAWELREVSSHDSHSQDHGVDHRRNLYFSDYTRDMWTVVKLKAMILEHCKSFLRAETIRHLGGESKSSSKIDEAFWRVWTFCKIFGGENGREHDILGQMDWLKGGLLARQSGETETMVLADEMSKNSVLYSPPPGFAAGNGNGLSADELYDMTEIWTCLGVLVRGYHEKRDMARKYGVFDRVRIPKGDVKTENAVLEEWTYYLLTQAPDVVLQAASPSSPSQETFAHVRSQGYTIWSPPPEGMSRGTFLKEALSRVYDEQMHKARPLMAGSPKGFSDLPQVVSPDGFSPHMMEPRQRIAAHQAELRAKKEDPSYRDVPMADERPMSNFHEVLARLESINTTGLNNTPNVPKIPNIASRLARRKPRVTEPLEERAKIVEEERARIIEEALSPASLSGSNSASPIATKPSRSARLGNFRSKIGGKAHSPALQGPISKQSLGSDKTKASQTSLHSYNSLDNASISTRSTMASHDSAEQREDAFLPMIDKLVALGFDEGKARRALDKNTSGNFIDFEKALTSLARQREQKKKMERLDRMG